MSRTVNIPLHIRNTHRWLLSLAIAINCDTLKQDNIPINLSITKKIIRDYYSHYRQSLRLSVSYALAGILDNVTTTLIYIIVVTFVIGA